MLLHIRIQLDGIAKPPIWRELTIPAQFSFLQLHQVIQAAFGWMDAHLFLFSPDGFASSPWIKIPDEQDESEDVRVLNAGRTTLRDIFPGHQKYTYSYDFGDNWRHKIKLLRISDGRAAGATLTAGKGACPPEDCGGAPGYAHLKQALNDPNDPEHDDLRNWLGLEADEAWDPAAFDLTKAQQAVAAVR